MELDDQLAMLRPSVEVENLVRAVAAQRSVTTVRRGDQISLSRAGAGDPALMVYPAAVSVAVDPARARALDGAPWLDRIEPKTATTSFVWVSSARLGAAFEDAVAVAVEAVDRRPRSTAAARAARQPAARASRTAPVAQPAAPPKICPRCGLQISAAGSCFCD